MTKLDIHAAPPRLRGARRAAHDAHAVTDQDVARQDEEQHGRLENAGRRLGHVHRGLRHLSADIGDGEDEAREEHADRMQPAEERDDDRGEAVARGKAEVDLAELAHHLENAGEAGHAAADHQGRPDGAGGVEAAVARRARGGADGAHREAVDRARLEHPENQRQHDGDDEPGRDDRSGEGMGQGLRAVNGGVCGKLWPFGSFQGPPIR